FLEETNFQDIKSFINFINKLEIEDDIKMHMINFYIDGERIYNEIINYSKTIIETIQRNLFLIDNDLDNSMNILQKNSAINLGYNYQLDFFNEPDLEVITCVVLSNQATLFKENDVTYAYVGYLLFDIIDAKERNQIDEAKIMEFLKLISDQTRMKILNLLKVKHMFVQELSKELQLTTPTLIHHVELLLNANLIDVYMNKEDKKRVFYKLNENRIKELLDMLGRNLLW
ncbi:MAG: metalloregulator ArsR/SmtB family transcription factor, partial [Bacilli bacterium]